MYFWRVLECVVILPFCVSGSVGKNLASKTNVYISSSAGARWREVSSWSQGSSKCEHVDCAPTFQEHTGPW